MTKKEQILFEIEVKKLLINLSLSNKLKVIERLGKEFRKANNIEIQKETTDFANKLTRSA
jgi:hypothetical protein